MNAVPEPLGSARAYRLMRVALLVAMVGGASTTLALGQAPAPAPAVKAPELPPVAAKALEAPCPPSSALCPPANAGLPLRLPTPPLRGPRPMTGPGSVAEFIETLSQNDAGFEVLVGQGRILTTRVDLAAKGKATALIAIGDPTVADFTVVSTRQVRIEGRRIGVTDLSIITPDNQTYNFEIRVVADLHVLRGQLACLFPDASVKLTQIRDAVVVEGQARDAGQVTRILDTVQAYLASVQAGQARQVTGQTNVPAPEPAPQPRPNGQPGTPAQPGDQPPAPGVAAPEASPIRSGRGTVPPPRVINLLRVPGSKQVLLKVRVAELNRTAFRQIGSDFLTNINNGSAIIGSQIGGGGVSANAATSTGALTGFAQLTSSSSTTAFGLFTSSEFAVLFSALRRNALLKVLAEPNLVAMNGHSANFLAGGEFPVPVPQTGGGGISPTITVQFKEFGVRLAFLPTILDGDVIRLAVDPEVSTIDTTLGTVLVPGGSPVPGLNTRRAHTVVEMREGQTLAIAGLLQLTMDGSTQRIPGLGDLPVIGPFFSNTTGNRVEKELIVLVTPHLVEPMNCDQVPPTPGDEVTTPDDFEFYVRGRIEGRTGRDWRATTQYEKQLPIVRCLLRLDAANVRGPCGFCE